MRLGDVGGLIAFALGLIVVVVALRMRHHKEELRHKERLLAMEKGTPLPPEPAGNPAPWTPRVYLLRGLMWLFTGVALTVMFLGISITPIRPPSVEHRLSTAQFLKRQGATDAEVQQYLQSPGQENQGLPLGFAFVGLVPAAVGLAYLVFYRTEGRKGEAA